MLFKHSESLTNINKITVKYKQNKKVLENNREEDNSVANNAYMF